MSGILCSRGVADQSLHTGIEESGLGGAEDQPFRSTELR